MIDYQYNVGERVRVHIDKSTLHESNHIDLVGTITRREILHGSDSHCYYVVIEKAIGSVAKRLYNIGDVRVFNHSYVKPFVKMDEVTKPHFTDIVSHI